MKTKSKHQQIIDKIKKLAADQGWECIVTEIFISETNQNQDIHFTKTIGEVLVETPLVRLHNCDIGEYLSELNSDLDEIKMTPVDSTRIEEVHHAISTLIEAIRSDLIKSFDLSIIDTYKVVYVTRPFCRETSFDTVIPTLLGYRLVNTHNGIDIPVTLDNIRELLLTGIVKLNNGDYLISESMAEDIACNYNEMTRTSC